MPDPRYAQPTQSTVTATQPKKKPYPQKLPQVQRQPLPPPAPPVAPTRAAPKGPPSPTLQKHGFMQGIGDFEDRAARAVEEYVKSYGVKPHPELVFHVARDPEIDIEDYRALFQVPLNATAAKAQATVSHTRPVHLQTPAELIAGLRKAVKDDSFSGYIQRHGKQLQQLQKDDRYKSTVNGIFHSRWDVNSPTAAGLGNPSAVLSALKMAALAGSQVAESLIYSPAGLYMAGKAGTLDAKDASGGDLSFKRSREIAVESAKQVADDFRNPGENPGFLVLDVFGLASLGAGGVARTANAARTGRAGALLEKPPLRRSVINHGGYTEEALLSSNPLVAAVQQANLGRRQKGADLRMDGKEPLPSASLSVLMPAKAEEFFARNFGFERKIGREAAARMRVEQNADLQLVRDLQLADATANRAAGIFGRVGRNKLSRGQQKAIWVLATDDPDPLQTNIEFHERMIEAGIGSKRDHQRQLADLKLAAKELENPSPGFEKALALTREVVDEMERIKIDKLGLSPLTAEGRVASLAQVLRGDGPTGGPKQFDDAFYLPTQPRGKVKPKHSTIRGRYDVSVGPNGIGPARDMPELTHEFTGKAIMAGNIRIDATNLAGEAYTRTVRTASVVAQHDKLFEHGSPTKRSEWDIPVRDTTDIPDALRELTAKLDEGDFTKAEEALLPADMATLIRELYPDEKTLTPDEIENVRWVDSRLVGDLEGAPSRSARAVTDVASAVNTPIRFARLYLRPAYILNKLGNAAMLVFDQGFMNSGVNWVRAMNADSTYGAANAKAIRAHVGAGKAMSYRTDRAGKATQAVAEFWARVTDRDERVASFIYYADRKGYKTPDEMNALLHDETKRGDLVEVTRRANKALVEFDNLTPIEKNVLRHLIFVYPWVSRSAVWSLRAILEHPAKTAVLANLGQQAIENDPFLDKAPDWFKRIGYIPLGMDKDGNPKVANASSVNTFTTLNQFLTLGKAGVSGDKYASAGDLLGPFGEFATHATTGRDEFGNRYPGSQFWGAAEGLLTGLPQLRQATRKEDKPLKPFDVTDRASLVARQRSALKQMVFKPGWLNGFGSLIAGGFAPRGMNELALKMRALRDLPAADRHKWEVGVLAQALRLQGELLKRPVPKDVAQAVRFGSDLTFRTAQWTSEHGRTPTDKERDQITEAFYKQRGLTPEDAEKMKGKLRRWDSDVRLVASFDKEVAAEKIRGLRAQGLAPSSSVPSQDKLYEYGRRYLDWTDKLRALKATDATAAEVRAFVDASDTAEGSLPSFAAMSWANLDREEQEDAVRRAAGSSWHSLSSFDKRLLGVKVAPEVSQGWAAFEKTVADYNKKPGNPSLAAEQKAGLANNIDKAYPGFARDYAFSRQPRAVQFEQTNVYKGLPDRALYDDAIGGPAKKLSAHIAALRKAGEPPNVTYYKRYWAQYVDEKVRPWLEEHPDLAREMDAMGEDFMDGLVG